MGPDMPSTAGVGVSVALPGEGPSPNPAPRADFYPEPEVPFNLAKLFRQHQAPRGRTTSEKTGGRAIRRLRAAPSAPVLHQPPSTRGQNGGFEVGLAPTTVPNHKDALSGFPRSSCPATAGSATAQR